MVGKKARCLLWERSFVASIVSRAEPTSFAGSRSSALPAELALLSTEPVPGLSKFAVVLVAIVDLGPIVLEILFPVVFGIVHGPIIVSGLHGGGECND